MKMALWKICSLDKKPKNRQFGLTVVELLVSVAIISVLLSFVIPGLRAFKERAKVAQCFASIRGIGNALQIYAAENDHHLPSLNEDNIGLEGGSLLDIRFELYKYDSAFWDVVCPSDPRQKNNPMPGNPTFISYYYMCRFGLDLAKLDAPTSIVEDGHYHGRPTCWKATKLYSDNHVELLE
jgi:prepilin-type N-terminal cleavage/methylation domain-containing protein